MSETKATAVFFDLVGTLIRVRGGVGLQYATLAKRFGIEADQRALEAAFPIALQMVPSPSFDTSRPEEVAGLERGFWRDIVCGVFHHAGIDEPTTGPRFEAYFEALFDHFSTEAGWEAYPDVEPELVRLRAAGYITALLTNFDGRVFRLLDRLRLRTLFDSVTLPGLAGKAKPDRAIFQHALDRHGLSASAAVHVGDSMSEDYTAARAAGLQTVLLDRKQRWADTEGVVRITSLSELAGALARLASGDVG
jgi:putative hydrolase of the HAD superfamily